MTMLRDESNTVAFNDLTIKSEIVYQKKKKIIKIRIGRGTYWVELSNPRKRESEGRERSAIVVVDPIQV